MLGAATAFARGTGGLDVDAELAHAGTRLLLLARYSPGCAGCAEAGWGALRDRFGKSGLRVVVVSSRAPDGSCAAPPFSADEVLCPDGADLLPLSSTVFSWEGGIVAQGTSPEAIGAAIEKWLAGEGQVAVVPAGREDATALVPFLREQLVAQRKLSVADAAKTPELAKTLAQALSPVRAQGLASCAKPIPGDALLEVRKRRYASGPRLDLLLLSGHGCVLADAEVRLGPDPRAASEAAVRRLLGALARPAPVTAQEPGATPRVRSAWGGDMVLIPSGDFWMGSDSGPADTRPRRRVYLDDYWIDLHEVTAAAYDTCVANGGCTRAQRGGLCTSGVPEKMQHPINCITWEQAERFCQFANTRLPTEAEWEKAARGPGPITVVDAFESAVSETAPVGSMRASISPYGVTDMAGNVWEWVHDWYDPDAYPMMPADEPKGPNAGKERVLRGGAMGHIVRVDQRTSFRMHFIPSLVGVAVGVRCAADAR